MTVSVQLKSDVARGFATLRARFPQAEVRSVNRAATSARVVMTSAVSKDMGLKSGTVKDRIRVENAKVGAPVARLSASLKRIPLIEFNARGPNPSRGKGRGVTARMPGGRGRYPHAFIATMGSSHTGVFERNTTKRLPIHELFGPSIGFVFGKYLPQGLARAQEQLVKNLRSELRFALQSAVAA